MIPWEKLAVARAPGGEELRLNRRGDEYSIRIGQNDLMNSRLSASEEALATVASEKLAGRPAPVLLIGGLGMGFTLCAALAKLPPDAKVVQVELVRELIEWARGPMASLFGDALDDPRVEIRVEDVGVTMRGARNAYDAILLDVDNGPEALTSRVNDALYGHAGLAVAFRALKPGGVLGVWSCAPDAKFAQRMREARFVVEEKRVKAHRGRSGARHVLWFGTRPKSG